VQLRIRVGRGRALEKTPGRNNLTTYRALRRGRKALCAGTASYLSFAAPGARRLLAHRSAWRVVTFLLFCLSSAAYSLVCGTAFWRDVKAAGGCGYPPPLETAGARHC